MITFTKANAIRPATIPTATDLNSQAQPRSAPKSDQRYLIANLPTTDKTSPVNRKLLLPAGPCGMTETEISMMEAMQSNNDARDYFSHSFIQCSEGLNHRSLRGQTLHWRPLLHRPGPQRSEPPKMIRSKCWSSCWKSSTAEHRAVPMLHP